MKPDPSRPGDRFCPYSDAVLALLLDGESDDQFVQEPGWEHGLSATEIARHRLDCPLCAEHIARARHLDALLAGATQIDFDSGEPDELLARVTAAAAEPISAEPTAVRGQGSRLPAGLVAAGRLLLGFFAGSFFWAAPEPLPEGAAGLPAQPEALTTQRELGDSLDPGMIRLPDRNGARAFARRSARQRRNRPLTPAQLVALARGSEVVTLACERYSDLARRSSLPGLWRAAQFLSKLGDAIMLHSIGELVDSTEAKARRMTIAALTDWPDGIALRSLLAQARDEVGLRTLLVRGAKDPQLLRAAARLGGVKLDQRLRSSAADSPGMLGKLVAALASLRERPGRVALLLDLWGDLAIKDGNLDDLALAKGWFSALPFPSGAEICEEFVRSRNAGSRRQCLLALAAQGRSSQSEFLQRIVAGPRLEESELAAYALGQIPAGADGLDERIDGNRRAYLLLTALACREDQRLSPIIERMELSEAERRFLAAGAFTLEQFDIAASLFRNRRSLAGL